MSFAGTYELQSHENFEVFMKAIGLPDELIQIGKDIKSVTKIEQNGDHFVVTVTTGPKVLRNEFDIGKESEIETLTEEKIKTTVNIVDGKLVVQLKSVKSVTELSGDILTNVMTLRDIVYKRVCLQENGAGKRGLRRRRFRQQESAPVQSAPSGAGRRSRKQRWNRESFIISSSSPYNIQENVNLTSFEDSTELVIKDAIGHSCVNPHDATN
ncbi:unnamed protein product [Ranitomeya imitator]|uniref:Cytosolic fatty-acid binding proteins domain-containing protein n=1 Tax=Ranitomeya imitator TaxID=111125 RepID=A0ABN9LEK7_9NEOB|nr:unnamed protein product [Ranitomeya imitator]